MNPSVAWRRITAGRLLVAGVAAAVSFALLGWWVVIYAAVAAGFVLYVGRRTYRDSEAAPAPLMSLLPRARADVRLLAESQPSAAGSVFVPRRGAGKRLVVIDRSVAGLPDAQLRAVVSHEHGHFATLPLVDDVALTLLVLGVLRAGTPESAGMWWLLVIFTTIAATVMLMRWLNRQSETAADAWAIAVDKVRPGDLADALDALAPAAGGEPGRLERLLGTHPPVADRVARLRAWQDHADAQRRRP